jgi:hypothetical protein
MMAMVLMARHRSMNAENSPSVTEWILSGWTARLKRALKFTIVAEDLNP